MLFAQHRPAYFYPETLSASPQLPEHAFIDDRSEVQPNRSSRALACCASARERAELPTIAMRAIGSSHVDPFSSWPARRVPLMPAARRRQRGGAAHSKEIDSADHIPAFIRGQAGEGRLMGFRSRGYKSYDPAPRSSRRRLRGVRVTGKPSARHRAESRRIALGTNTSSDAALSEGISPRSHLPGDGFPVRCSPCCSDRPVGLSRSGKRCCSIPDPMISRQISCTRGSHS